MSWLDDIVDIGSSVFNWFTGSSIGANIARTAVAGYALNKVTASINKDNDAAKQTEPDPGVRLQVNPDPEHKIPVVYGTAYLGGIVTDATLTNSNQTMWYCLTICEKTGNTNLGSGAASVIHFDEIYWNDQKINFNADGTTVASLSDRSGNTDTSISGQVKIYCYRGSSATPVAPTGYTLASPLAAFDLFPGWTATHTMSDLIFALVRVDYSKEKNVTGLADVKFKMRNTMFRAGDVLYDYMTNTRYGAGIDPAEINVS